MTFDIIWDDTTSRKNEILIALKDKKQSRLVFWLHSWRIFGVWILPFISLNNIKLLISKEIELVQNWSLNCWTWINRLKCGILGINLTSNVKIQERTLWPVRDAVIILEIMNVLWGSQPVFIWLLCKHVSSLGPNELVIVLALMPYTYSNNNPSISLDMNSVSVLLL